jgi:DNA sulfur modification protein DndB
MAGKFQAKSGKVFPVLRGTQGGRVMYAVMLSNEVLNEQVSPEMEPTVERSQRALDPKRAQAIGNYVTENQAGYVLGSLIYALDQEGEFEPVEPGASIGLLHLPMNAKMRSVDGQHRRRGIKEAIDVADWVNEDDTVVLFYVEQEPEKRKQMFSDINWNARPVSKSVNVAFESRDPFSRATNQLVSEHPLLKYRIERERAWITSMSDKLYTLGAIYDTVIRLVVGPDKKKPVNSGYTEEHIIERGAEFFDLLFDARDELQQAVANVDETVDLRKTTILLNGTTLKVLAGAFWLARKQGVSTEDIARHLSELDFRPEADIWQKSGFVAPGKTTPAARNQEIRAATDAVLTFLVNAAEPVAVPA